jgi:ferrous iron transport protein A
MGLACKPCGAGDLPPSEYRQTYIIQGKEKEEMLSLRDVKSGGKVRVVKVDGQGAMKKRIMDMGITVHTELTVRKVAPLGDPVEITVRGYELSLRKADIECIQVEEITGGVK